MFAPHRSLLSCTAYLFLSLVCAPAFAETSDKLWPEMREKFFQNREVEEVDFLNVSGPRISENGGQVPITLSMNWPKTNSPIKTLYLLIDANPRKLAATYKISESLHSLELTTRIRMDSDSYIRLVGEDATGKLFMSKTAIDAGGGCGATISAEGLASRYGIGNIKLNASNPPSPGDQSIVAFLIKHPMLSGLQRHAESKEYIPAYYITKTVFTYNNEAIIEANFGASTSENPYLRFKFDPKTDGTLIVRAEDNEGAKFVKEFKLSL